MAILRGNVERRATVYVLLVDVYFGFAQTLENLEES